MNNSPKISVVIPAFNEAEYIRKSINSIIQQSFTDIEILVIDDASDDNTCSIVEAVEDSRVRLIKNSKNCGVVSNLNLALQEARGLYLARMDADDMSLPKRLEKQYRLMENESGCAVVGAGIYLLNYRRQDFKKVVPVCSDQQARKEMLANNPVNTGTAFYRRQALLDVGGFNPAHSRGEGYSILLKLADWGTIRNIPDIEYVYFVRDEHGNRCMAGGFRYRNFAMANMTRTAGRNAHSLLGELKGRTAALGWSLYHYMPRAIQISIRNVVSSKKHIQIDEDERRHLESLFDAL